MTDKILKTTDFATEKTQVFDCGLDNRDPQRGYRKARSVQNTEIAKMIEGNVASVPAQDLGNER